MKMDPIRIRRPMANGLVMEVELTEDEVYRVFEHYEHHCDKEYVFNNLAQRECEDLQPLTDKQWIDAVRNIAYEKRRQQDKYNLDEDYALDEALKWYINAVLPEIPKRYFVIRYSKGSCLCWAYEVPSVEEASTYCKFVLGNDFEKVVSLKEIDAREVTDYGDADEWDSFEFIRKVGENNA